MKYCKDCVLHGRELFGGPHDCAINNQHCERERAPLTLFERIFGTKRCGPDARFFEAKGGES